MDLAVFYVATALTVSQDWGMPVGPTDVLVTLFEHLTGTCHTFACERGSTYSDDLTASETVPNYVRGVTTILSAYPFYHE